MNIFTRSPLISLKLEHNNYKYNATRIMAEIGEALVSNPDEKLQDSTTKMVVMILVIPMCLVYGRPSNTALDLLQKASRNYRNSSTNLYQILT